MSPRWLRPGVVIGFLFLVTGCERNFFLEPGAKTTLNGTIYWSSRPEDRGVSLKPAPGNKEIPKGDGCHLDLGIGPWQSPELMVKAYQPLLDYLSHVLECTFLLHISPDYNTLKSDLRDNNVQVALLAPNTYSAALEEYPTSMRYIATGVKEVNGEKLDSYHGYIFALKSSGIFQLADLKGSTFGFVEKGSTSGYSYPMAILLKQKISPRSFFKRTLFLGTHNKVTDAVINGTVDAGAAWDSIYHIAVHKHGDIFHLIEKTDPIPYDPWVVNTTVSKKFAEAMQTALVGITLKTRSPQGALVLGDHTPFSGYVVRGPKFYGVIKEVRELLRTYQE